MIKHAEDKVFVYDTNYASQGHFFTGTLNMLELAFDPLITGYAFIKWTTVPNWIMAMYPAFQDMTEKNFKAFGGISDIELGTTGVTHGFNANEYMVATGTQKGNTEFTMTHQEFSGSPMRQMYQFWISGVRDPETGIATYPKLFNTDYAAKNHTGELMYIVTRPDANNVDRTNIEFAAYYAAVMPTRILLGHFNHTIGTHDAVEYEQNFKGNFYISSKVDAFANVILKQRTYGMLEMGEFDPVEPHLYRSDLSQSNGYERSGQYEASPSEWLRDQRDAASLTD